MSRKYIEAMQNIPNVAQKTFVTNNEHASDYCRMEVVGGSGIKKEYVRRFGTTEIHKASFPTPIIAYDFAAMCDLVDTIRTGDLEHGKTLVARAFAPSGPAVFPTKIRDAMSLSSTNYEKAFLELNLIPLDGFALLNPSVGTLSRFAKTGRKHLDIYLTCPIGDYSMKEYRSEIARVTMHEAWVGKNIWCKTKELPDIRYYCSFTTPKQMGKRLNIFGFEVNPYVASSKGISIVSMVKGASEYDVTYQRQGYQENYLYPNSPSEYRYLGDVITRMANLAKTFKDDMVNGIFNFVSTIPMFENLDRDVDIPAAVTLVDVKYVCCEKLHFSDPIPGQCGVKFVLGSNEQGTIEVVDTTHPYSFETRQWYLRNYTRDGQHKVVYSRNGISRASRLAQWTTEPRKYTHISSPCSTSLINNTVTAGTYLSDSDSLIETSVLPVKECKQCKSMTIQDSYSFCTDCRTYRRDGYVAIDTFKYKVDDYGARYHEYAELPEFRVCRGQLTYEGIERAIIRHAFIPKRYDVRIDKVKFIPIAFVYNKDSMRVGHDDPPDKYHSLDPDVFCNHSTSGFRWITPTRLRYDETKLPEMNIFFYRYSSIKDSFSFFNSSGLILTRQVSHCANLTMSLLDYYKASTESTRQIWMHLVSTSIASVKMKGDTYFKDFMGKGMAPVVYEDEDVTMLPVLTK